MGAARGRIPRRGAAGPAAAVAAFAVLLAGCGADHVRAGAGADGKDPGGHHRPSAPAHHPSPSHTPLPQETSTPDPALPPPVVSMDIAHAALNGGKAVNITIDDGPDPTWTPKVLEALADNHVKATFCMIGPQAAAHPDLVKAVVAAGHRLCDHTVHHDETMDHKSRAYQKHEILAAADQITRASGGVRPLYYRAPGGAFTPYSRQIAAAAGLRPLGWNVDAKDWERPGVPAIEATVKDELPNGPTILFHDGGGDRHQTVEALEALLPWLRAHGHSFSFPVR
ncbi:polysaccharide deacetylase family protein [Streptomyces sp. NRRL F-5126]|uniref:polysaccharide deacetylase family protein n=1 Tax=Streptomyces sp. NRRL F-5126 TaxID=1463857 RepID=UPI00099BEF8F|nr:polysaccharide deacetylase family protein [Streptomyces sp. NRRL F-5126]